MKQPGTQSNAEPTAIDREALIRRFRAVRARTEALARPLSAEDQQLQSMPSCSPTKWHRAHTTWFFETFLLIPRGAPEYQKGFGFLYNSYYESAGPRFARPSRGLVSRPSIDEIAAYRRAVDGRTTELIASADDIDRVAPLIELGLAHEEQHQELVLTDILHALSLNPLAPAYRAPARERERAEAEPLRFVPYDGGLFEIGARGRGFTFDNEGPRHKVFLEPFELGKRLVTVGELKAFVRERGYETPSLWLSEGYELVRSQAITAPQYGRIEGGAYVTFSLDGEREAHDAEPIAHLSYYEADALAHFLGARLPTEAEWEVAATACSPRVGNQLDDDFFDQGALGPLPPTRSTAGGAQSGDSGTQIAQAFGDVWEWTSSSYDPYPGFEVPEGALGEYNGKFMVNQKVLRGGSCFTPRGHVRSTYRNFWHPDTRFQMSGLRLARGPRSSHARRST